MAIAIPATEPEILRADGTSALVLTCEHASDAVPASFEVSPADRAALATHWGVDIGAADLTRALSAALDAPAVLGVVSRLVLDLNRAPEDPTLVRPDVEGRTLGFNAHLEPAARQERIRRLHVPYHRAVDEVLTRRAARQEPTLLLSIHSFTPNYMGHVRDVEMGVLYDVHEQLGLQFRDDLGSLGWDARMNEPWSGLDGLIYAAHRHGRAHAVPYLELEVRQDLIGTPHAAEALATRLLPCLDRLLARLG